MINKIYGFLTKEEQEEVLQFAFRKLLPDYEIVKKPDLTLQPQSEPLAEEPEPAKESHSRRGRPIILGAVTMDSLRQACESADINYQSVHRYRKNHNCTRQQAFDAVYKKTKGEYNKKSKVVRRPSNQTQIVDPVELTVGGESLRSH